MKLIRKIILLIVVLFVAFGPVNVNADQAPENNGKEGLTYQISEYDFYTSVRSMQFSEAEKIYGISKDDYESICSVEKKLAELALLNNDELLARGMNTDQITELRSYDGSRLEDNPQLRSVLATLSVTLSKVNSSSSAVTVKANWSWSSKPAVTSVLYYETAVFRWKAYNSSNAQITATYNSSGSYCYVTYYNGNTAQTSQWTAINTGSSTSYVYSQYHSDIMSGDNYYWAKTGYMIVKVTGSNISKVGFGFGYNHGISSTPTSITLDSNLGFNYSNGYEMAEQSITIYV